MEQSTTIKFEQMALNIEESGTNDDFSLGACVSCDMKKESSHCDGDCHSHDEDGEIKYEKM